MVEEFGNSTDDSSEGDFDCDEGASPFNVTVRNARNDDDYEEDPEEESNGDNTQEKGVIHKG